MEQKTSRTPDSTIAFASDSSAGDTIILPSLPSYKKPEVTLERFIPITDTSDFLILVANKAVRSLYVLQRHNTIWKTVKEYDIAIGEQEGRKVTAGDRRTPEGHYCILGRKEYSELSSIYGPLAYVLDYPNEEDRRAGRTGQGIWIHGTDPDSQPFQTRGCIEMENSRLRDLSTMVKSGIGTPVVILFDTNLTDPTTAPDYRLCEERRREVLINHNRMENEFRTLILSWKAAWESKRIDEYMAFYDSLLFNGQGLDWIGWKERKLRTFGLYDTIAITIENVRVSDAGDNSTVVKFLQRYRTNLNNIENGKKIYFKKVNDLWKITGEATCPKEELLL